MADVKIRNVPDWIIRWHKLRAEREGVSLEQHLRAMLEADVAQEWKTLGAKLARHRAEIESETGVLPDSTRLIRQAREEQEKKFDARPGRQRGGEVAGPRRKTA